MSKKALIEYMPTSHKPENDQFIRQAANTLVPLIEMLNARYYTGVEQRCQTIINVYDD